MNELIVRVIDFPSADVKGIIKEDENGDYNIYINAKYNDVQQMETYFHEVAHAELGHLHDDRPVMVKESEAEKKSSERVRFAAHNRLGLKGK